MTEEATVLTEAADGVLVITINRPAAKNAVNRSVSEGIAAALDTLDADDGLRVGCSRVPVAVFARVWI